MPRYRTRHPRTESKRQSTATPDDYPDYWVLLHIRPEILLPGFDNCTHGYPLHSGNVGRGGDT